ncbi:MAG: hypothetical protein R3199_05595 [Gemmatimonadota bacterium]|nr:hypothetical protein [Gemmatimonadota bacterium]
MLPRSLARSLRLLPALVVALVALGCLDGDGDGPVGPDRLIVGSADFTSYVAIGNSLTAGFTDAALFVGGQECSVPRLLAGQVGIGDFEQPLVSDPGISSTPGRGKLELVSLQPLVIQRTQAAGAPTNLQLPRPYDNLGVPGALGFEALTAESAETSLGGNPFFDLVLREQGTWLEQTAALEASFVTVWLGNNDVLGFAASGGTAAGLPIPVTAFGAVYQALVNQLVGITGQVVLFNIPDVTSIPFLTTIPPFVVNPQTGQPVLGPDGRPIPLIGPEGPLAGDDLVTLNAAAALAQGVGIPAALGGTGQPLPDAVVLNVAEQQVAGQAVAGYNQVIAGMAAQHDLPLVDVNALLEELATDGIQAGGQLLTDDFIVGQAFSLDGVHPTCKGYGVVANRLIATINAAFGSSIPTVDVAALPGNPLPGMGVEPAAGLGVPRFENFEEVPLPEFAPIR